MECYSKEAWAGSAWLQRSFPSAFGGGVLSWDYDFWVTAAIPGDRVLARSFMKYDFQLIDGLDSSIQDRSGTRPGF
jgi:hypothetical protein